MYTLIQNCPKARSSVYANGSNIYRNKIARSKSLEEKAANIDSLMNLYDYRLQAFADDKQYGEVYITKNKAKDYYKYRAEDKQGMLKLFRRGIEIDPEIDATFINQYFTVLVEEYEALNVETDHFMNEYEYLAEKMDKVTDEEAKTSFDALLIKSGAADCANLEQIFSARLENNWNDAKQVEKAFKLMARNHCESDFFLSVGEKYYAVKQESSIAMLLAQVFQNRKDFAKANQYLREALVKEADATKREELLTRIGILEMTTNNYAAAISAFNESLNIDADDDDGLALYFLAQCYVAGAKDCNSELAKHSVYWLAYDLVQKALPLLEVTDAAVAENAKNLANSYRSVFPTTEECFFAELREGATYTINCGLAKGLQTKVRYRAQ